MAALALGVLTFAGLANLPSFNPLTPPRLIFRKPFSPAAENRACHYPAKSCSASDQAKLKSMQLGFRHRSLEVEYEPVIVIGGVVNPLLVDHDDAGHRAQGKQPLPVHRRPCQTRYLDCQDRSHFAVADRICEADEACAFIGAG
jgi:hypothetical protein